MATKHKLTIERIEQLKKVVIEEIENSEIDQSENRTSSLEKTVLSNVRGVIFPLEISIYNAKLEEQTCFYNEDKEDNTKENNFDNKSLNTDGNKDDFVDYCNNKHNLVQLENTKECKQQFFEEDNSEKELASVKEVKLDKNIIDLNDSDKKLVQLKSTEENEEINSKENTLNKNVMQLKDTEDAEQEKENKIKLEEEIKTPVSVVSSSSNISEAIKAPLDNKENDSGIEGSPDIRNQETDEKVAAANELSRYHYRRQSSLKNAEEIKFATKN